tara:strand:+ start:338 stop:1156 length:819 start_codon:yes stop_codon:yes gene_type:complete
MNVILLSIILVIIINYIVTFKEGYTDEVQKIIEVLNNNNIDKNIIDNIGNDLDNTEICSAEIKYTGESNYAISLNLPDRRELAMKDYKLKIESGENFHMKLKELEEKVFKLYYNDTWQEEYNKMLEKRQPKIEVSTGEIIPKIETCDKQVTSTLNINLTKDAIDILKYLEDLEEFTINNYDTYDKSEILSRKLHYRNKEESKIEWINSWFNYIYYILYIVYVLLSFNQGKFFTNKYIIIILSILPTIIYPGFYKILKNINMISISLYPINSF